MRIAPGDKTEKAEVISLPRRSSADATRAAFVAGDNPARRINRTPAETLFCR